ncbi:hypothetical protein SAMN05518872_102503 [Psychrobacillus sp. OK032]|nr:hypothetical protein SAMN05518872_102503 [Psychrobacillus sp. OK032]
MTEYGTVLFLLYMALIGSGLFVWTIRSPKGESEK